MLRAYLLCGFAWTVGQSLYVLYHPVAGHRDRETMSQWTRALWALYAIVQLVIAAAWPLHMLITIFPGLVGEAPARGFRRLVLDKPGLLEPKRPPPRCLVHNEPFRLRADRCARCKEELGVLTCRSCVAEIPGWEPGLFFCEKCGLAETVAPPPSGE